MQGYQPIVCKNKTSGCAALSLTTRQPTIKGGFWDSIGRWQKRLATNPLPSTYKMDPDGNICKLKSILTQSYFEIKEEFIQLKARVSSLDPANLSRRPQWVSKDIRKFKNLVESRLKTIRVSHKEARGEVPDPADQEFLQFAQELIGFETYPGVLESLAIYATHLIDYHLGKKSPKEVMATGLSCCEAQFEMQGFLLKNLTAGK
jgi:hypothetical protein